VEFGKDLLWGLAELRYLGFKGETLHGVLQDFEVNLALVGDWVEDIVVFNGALLHSEDEVDPFMQVQTYMFAFQGFTVLPQEFFGSLSPLRQNH
jgi:hypothetical protein